MVVGGNTLRASLSTATHTHLLLMARQVKKNHVDLSSFWGFVTIAHGLHVRQIEVHSREKKNRLRANIVRGLSSVVRIMFILFWDGNSHQLGRTTVVIPAKWVVYDLDNRSEVNPLRP